MLLISERGNTDVSASSRVSGGGSPAAIEVLVASDQTLVREAVKVALTDRGLRAHEVAWDGAPRTSVPPLPRFARSRGVRVGLLVCSLDRWSLLYEARLVMAATEVPWAVLTDAAPGAAWGGLLVGGADVVMPGRTSLDEVCQTLVHLSEHRVTMPREEWTELVADWLDSSADREANAVRIAKLSNRQRRVLELLHLGFPVAQIAARLGVAPSTVRSQVKEILRRLEVGSQLAAVAAYEVDRAGPGRPATRPQVGHGRSPRV